MRGLGVISRWDVTMRTRARQISVSRKVAMEAIWGAVKD
jgi:hypothetical protein